MKKIIFSSSLLVFSIAFGNIVHAQVAVSVRVGAPVYCPPGKVIIVKPAPVVVVPARPVMVVPTRRMAVVHVAPPVYVTARPRRVIVVR